MNRLLFPILALNFLCFAQAPEISWQKTFGGTASDDISAILETNDGFLISGSSNSPISADKTVFNGFTDSWLIKFNVSGDNLWQNSYANDEFSGFYIPQTVSLQILPTSNLIIGTTKPDFDTAYMNLIELNSEGSVLLIGSTGTSANCQTDTNGFGTKLTDFLKTSDSNFLSCGTFSSPLSLCDHKQSFYIEKRNSIDTSGSPIFSKFIGGNGDDILTSCVETTDGNYLLFGYSDSPVSGDKTAASLGLSDYWIVKLNSSGNIIWQRTIGGSGIEISANAFETPDGGYMLGGSSESNGSGDKIEDSKGGYDYWIVKLSASGIVEWQKTIGGSLDDKLSKIRTTNDGGYVLCGTSNSPISGDKSENSKGGNDIWLVRLSQSGTVLWDKTIGGSASDTGSDIVQTSDGGFAIAATSASSISGDKTENSRGGNDYWILKLEPEILSVNESASVNLQIYPNPFTDEFTVSCGACESCTVTIFDMSGRIVYQSGLSEHKTISVNLERGIYGIETVNTNNLKKSAKIVKR